MRETSPIRAHDRLPRVSGPADRPRAVPPLRALLAVQAHLLHHGGAAQREQPVHDAAKWVRGTLKDTRCAIFMFLMQCMAKCYLSLSLLVNRLTVPCHL